MFFDWYVTIKILETLDRVLKVNYDILFYVEYFDKATFSANQRHITAAGGDKANLDNYSNFDEGYPDTFNNVRTFTWRSNF